jgi:hypothetical protein
MVTLRQSTRSDLVFYYFHIIDLSLAAEPTFLETTSRLVSAGTGELADEWNHNVNDRDAVHGIRLQ